jgi:outer membrane protein assembly factor BamA
MMLGLALALLLPLQQAPDRTQPQPREVVAEVLVHGNQIVPDAEVRTLAGIAAGSPFDDAMLADVAKRLKSSGKFESIEVLKRFASIEDASRIIVVIVVSEGPVRIVTPKDPNSPTETKKRSVLRNLMFVPLMEGSDGYGLTIGVRVAYPKPLGHSSRVSFPMTWGGSKRIGVELEKTFTQGPFSRIEFGGVVQHRMNPAYDTEDDRTRLWARAFRKMGAFRAGGAAGWQDVSFGGRKDAFTSAGLDVTLDTRDNPSLPRNAVLATAAVETLFFDSGEVITRTRMEGTAYVGVVGQQVLILHGLRDDADSPLPPYLRPILGGWWTLRGFPTGFMTGDTLVSGSLEYRVPIRFPLRIGKVGVSGFVDWGTAYNHNQSLKDQPIYRGAGGTIWMAVASARFAVALAYGEGSGARVHFTGSIGF